METLHVEESICISIYLCNGFSNQQATSKIFRLFVAVDCCHCDNSNNHYYCKGIYLFQMRFSFLVIQQHTYSFNYNKKIVFVEKELSTKGRPCSL